MTISKECSEMVGRFKKHDDDAWCDGFINAWNAHVCAVDGLVAMIDEYESRLAALAAQLDETLKQLAEMTEGFNLLADRMRERRNG